jgi:hypothetical protein
MAQLKVKNIVFVVDNNFQVCMALSFHYTSIQNHNAKSLFLGVDDYSPVSNMELRFRVASATQPHCADIQLIDDSIRENNETFFVMLNSSDGAVVINPSTAAVIIINDDGKLRH